MTKPSTKPKPTRKTRQFSVSLELPIDMPVNTARVQLEEAVKVHFITGDTKLLRVWRPRGDIGARIRLDERSTAERPAWHSSHNPFIPRDTR
jgi:rRNA maturation protein Rpf1